MKILAVIFALAATGLAFPAHGGGQRGGPPNSQNIPTSTTASAAASTATKAAGGTIDASLVPDFGITPGVPSTSQPGSCVGANGKNIPCNCPPSHSDFVAKLNLFQSQGNAQGTAFNFPTDLSDQSTATKLARITLCIIGLQNFDNTAPGVGCPAASAPNFTALQASLH